MKKGVWIIGIVILAILAILGIFLYNNFKSNLKPTEEFNPVFAPGPPLIVYKTKADYYSFVPIELSEDKSKIASYPDIRDVYYNGKLAYPINLSKGYLLDNRGIWKDSVFLNITYEQYSKLGQTPSQAELISWIIDKDPFLEMYDCGIPTFREPQEINSRIIDSGKLSKCRRII